MNAGLCAQALQTVSQGAIGEVIERFQLTMTKRLLTCSVLGLRIKGVSQLTDYVRLVLVANVEASASGSA